MKITTGDLLDALEQYGKELPKRPVGKGWHTIGEMAEKKHLSISALRQQIKVAIRNGVRIERFTGSDYDATGHLVKQTWFRVKP